MKSKVNITQSWGGPIIPSRDLQDLCHKRTDYIMTSALRKALLLVEFSPPILSRDVFTERSHTTRRSRFGALVRMISVLSRGVVCAYCSTNRRYYRWCSVV